MKILAVLLSLVLLVGAGCSRSKASPPPVEQAAEFGHLPGLRTTTDLALRDELARIEDEKATPELLMRPAVSLSENVATGLAELFPASRVSLLLRQSADLFPSATFTFTPLGLEKAIRFKNRHDTQRQRVREVLRRPTCDFGIRYMAGFGASLAFTDVVQLCARLEAFEAAECLHKANVDGAIEAVRQMLRLASCLAGEKHVTARVQGAYLRTEALTVLQAVVHDPKLNRKHLEQLHAVFAEELTRWPPDANAWIGERAIGLHAYELVRAGQAETLLTQDEVTQLTEKGILAEFPRITKRTVDQDERFYLQAMRRIIESCSQPYYVREKVFAELRGDLQQRTGSPDYPIVAGRLLLTQIQQGQAVQAQDRANCEAWMLALALATRRPAPAYQVNPLTGQKYLIAQEKGHVQIGNLSPSDDTRPVTVFVPDLGRTSPGK